MDYDDEEYIDDEFLEPEQQEPSLGEIAKEEGKNYAKNKAEDYIKKKISDRKTNNKGESSTSDSNTSLNNNNPTNPTNNSNPNQVKKNPNSNLNSPSTDDVPKDNLMNKDLGQNPSVNNNISSNANTPQTSVKAPGGNAPTKLPTSPTSTGAGGTGTSAAKAASTATKSAATGTGTTAAGAGAGASAAGASAGAAGAAAAGTGTATATGSIIAFFSTPAGWITLGVVALFIIILFIIISMDNTVNNAEREYNKKYEDVNYNGTSLDYLKELVYTTEISTNEHGDPCYVVEDQNGIYLVGPSFTTGKLKNETVETIIANKGYDEFFAGDVVSGYSHKLGECIDVEIIDYIIITHIYLDIEEEIREILKENKIELQIHQIDALSVLAYSEGNEYIPDLVNAFKNSSYEELWEVMKKIGLAEIEENLPEEEKTALEEYNMEIMKRRKSEFSLFVTGDYQDTEYNFYEGRALEEDEETGETKQMSYKDYYEEYHDYDSENVIENIFTGLLGYSTNGEYWWPIGSNAEGNGMASGTPTTLYISSYFGWRDLDGNPNTGVDGKEDYHRGLDIAGGGLIIAAKSGTVVEVRNSIKTWTGGTSWGNLVKIKHDDGNYTLYGHLAPNSITVSTGSTVTQGQIIGTMGTTGGSTGVHLHFEVYVGCASTNCRVDPLQFITPNDPRPQQKETKPPTYLEDIYVPL